MARTWFGVRCQKVWRNPEWRQLKIMEQLTVFRLAGLPQSQTVVAPVEDLYELGVQPAWLYACIDAGWVDYPSGGVRLSEKALELFDPMPPYQGERFHIPARVRREVYQRDGHRCVECGTDESLSLDHVMPWSLGGADTVENLQTMCRSCNSRKGARWVG